jgi:hypothetical protein
MAERAAGRKSSPFQWFHDIKIIRIQAGLYGRFNATSQSRQQAVKP